MLKRFFTLLSLSLVFYVSAQEVEIPLTVDVDLINPKAQTQIKTNGCVDSTFQSYTYSTLNIPVWDDFSENKFVDYNLSYTDPNVSSVLYYKIMDQNNATALPANIMLCDSLLAHKKTTILVSGNATTNIEYFTTGQFYTINDLCTYPVQGEVKKLYQECYIIYDTIIDGVQDPTIDTIPSTPNYLQDSVRVFSAVMSDPNSIWIDDFACRNFTYAIAPWSLGVATLDGVSNDGYPYDWGAIDTYGDADVLTSKPINLSGKTNVYLTFLYQAKGLGNSPEVMDSLVLDVYSSSLGHWQPLWSIDGDVADDTWFIAHIPITQFDLLQPDFQFRFRNKATLTGVLDHWHIDYVNLRDNSTAADTIIDDLAIVYPVNTLLKDFTSVPWDHYVNLNTPNGKMKTIEEITVRNNHTSAKLQNSGGLDVDGNNFTLPVSTPNWNVGLNTYDISLAALYTFPQVSLQGDKADFDVKVNMATSSTNIYTVNDTAFFTQSFRNFYALDDGSAETAYGFDVYNAKTAMRFTAYEADTLTGVFMKFIPSNNDVSNEIFLLTIWEDNNGVPGDVIYQDSYFDPHHPIYAGNKGSFKYYTFNDNQFIPVPQSYFIGFEQIDDKMLYIGKDKNIDNSDKIYYQTSGNWVNTSLTGTLIIRPVYSTALNYTLGIRPKKVKDVLSDNQIFNIYPNPTNNLVTIDGLQQNQKVELYDLTGRKIFSTQSNQLNIQQFEVGVYVVCIFDKSNQMIYTQKLIKQ
jgi:hypothetical protein